MSEKRRYTRARAIQRARSMRSHSLTCMWCRHAVYVSCIVLFLRMRDTGKVQYVLDICPLMGARISWASSPSLGSERRRPSVLSLHRVCIENLPLNGAADLVDC